MKTAIIILNYNSEDDTIRFVNEIKEFNVLDKIIVVDNLSPNGDFERLKVLESEKVDVIQSERNGGYSYGNNYGIKHMEKLGEQFDCVIISNPDIRITEDAIKPEYLYNNVINIMINTIPTTPATSVFNKEFSPNADPTVCDEISLNLTLLEPEFIKSTKFLTCSSVKLP